MVARYQAKSPEQFIILMNCIAVTDWKWMGLSCIGSVQSRNLLAAVLLIAGKGGSMIGLSRKNCKVMN